MFSSWSCTFRLILPALLLLLAVGAGAWADNPGPGGALKSLRVYVGTYTRGTGSQGIQLFNLDLGTGTLTPQGLAGKADNPSFQALDPGRRFLYSVNEISDHSGKRVGGVSAFAIDPATGRLTLLNQQASGGSGPCHVSVDRWRKNVLVANYGGGSVAVLPIDDKGQLRPASCFIQHKGSGPNPKRQAGPHAHSINLDPANRFALVADLGLDRVFVYRFDPEKGTLTPNEPPSAVLAPAAGPRHLAFHPDGHHVYVINELDSTVTAFAYDPEKGTLQELQAISTLPADFKGKSYCAEVVVHPSGRFLYGSNRGHDSIAIFTIDRDTGRLISAGYQGENIKTPRNFAIEPTGTYLLAANQDGHSIVVFRINLQTGALQPTGKPVKVASPVCVRMIALP
jgi:6-phosphogluconolactonase